MPKGIDGRLLRRRAPPLLACLLVALVTAALAAGCGGSDRSDSGSGSTGAGAAVTTSADDGPRGAVEAGGLRKVVAVRPVRQDRFAYARERFTELCAGCHTLADAGATGRRFNLDRGAGLDETHVRSTIAEGEPGMPAWRHVISKREFEELVAYLVAVGGRARGSGDDYWSEQLKLRGDGEAWTRADTERLERYAQRINEERTPRE